MSYRALTDRQVEHLEKQIQLESYIRTRMYSYFKVNGLIEPVGPGLDEAITTILRKMKPGQISMGVQSLPDSHMRLDPITTKMAIIGTVVVANVKDVDAWRHNSGAIGKNTNLISLAVAEQIQEFYDYIDRFCFYGDDIKDPLDLDDMVGAGEFTGVMNGFTAFAAGGGDDIVQAAGDYITTCDSATKALKIAGWDSDQYHIFSDLNTWNAAAAGNNFYATSALIERDRVIERPDIKSWQSSANCYDNAGTAYRMAFMSPQSSKASKGQLKRTKPHRLLQGYNFKIFPLYGGGLDRQLNYNIAIVHSLAVEETHPLSIYRTGTLTL